VIEVVVIEAAEIDMEVEEEVVEGEEEIEIEAMKAEIEGAMTVEIEVMTAGHIVDQTETLQQVVAVKGAISVIIATSQGILRETAQINH